LRHLTSDYADLHILLSLLPLTNRTPFTKDILTAYHPKNSSYTDMDITL